MTEYKYNDLSDLEGTVVNTILLDSEDYQYVSFETDKGVFHYVITGDCCSHSYISDFNRLRNLIGKKVNKVEFVEQFEEDKWDKEEDELTQTYGVRFHTDEGIAVLIFRNESNGYYGGNTEKSDSIPGDVNMKEITSDFTATYKHTDMR